MKKSILLLLFSLFIIAIIYQETQKKLSLHEGIISISPAQTQILDYIGLGDKISLVSSYESDPRYKQLPKITGGINFYEEDLILHPHKLILLGNNQRNNEIIPFLEKNKQNYLIIDCDSFGGMLQAMRDLSHLYPLDVKKDKIAFFSNQISQIQDTNTKTALIIINIDPIYSATRSSYLSEYLNSLGWNNIIQHDNKYPLLNEEDIIKLGKVDGVWLLDKNFSKEKTILSFLQKHLSSNIYFFPREARIPNPYLLN